MTSLVIAWLKTHLNWLLYVGIGLLTVFILWLIYHAGQNNIQAAWDSEKAAQKAEQEVNQGKSDQINQDTAQQIQDYQKTVQDLTERLNNEVSKMVCGSTKLPPSSLREYHAIATGQTPE